MIPVAIISTYFRHILNWLRAGGRDVNVSDLSLKPHEIKQLRCEADFYQLSGIRSALDGELARIDKSSADEKQTAEERQKADEMQQAEQKRKSDPSNESVVVVHAYDKPSTFNRSAMPWAVAQLNVLARHGFRVVAHSSYGTDTEVNHSYVLHASSPSPGWEQELHRSRIRHKARSVHDLCGSDAPVWYQA